MKAALSAAFLLAMVISSSGQDIHDHSSGHDMYKHWRQPGGGISCCSNRDCGPWPEEDVQPVKDGFWIRSLEKFVPMTRVLPSPDGQYHVCCRRTSADLPCERNKNGEATVFCLAAPMGY